MKIAIYLAGSIKKGHEKSDGFYWTDDHMDFLKNALESHEVSFLNPAFRTDDLSEQFSVFGRDMTQVYCSDLVFVDARDRRGLGVGAEMMWAKVNQIPVLTWAPKNTHYHQEQTTILDVAVSNFIHPFVESLSDQLVENLAEGAEWIDALMKGKAQEIKGIDLMQRAMRAYHERQFDRDVPMQELMQCNEKFQRLHSRSEKMPV